MSLERSSSSLDASGAVTRLKRKEGRPSTGGGFNITNLLKVSADDVQGEVEQFQKNRTRLEKANEKLLKELEETTKKENEWDEQIQTLEKVSREKAQILEERIKKTAFDWEKERKNLTIDAEKLGAKADEVEGDLDEAADKIEREQEKELAELRDELARTRKGGEEAADRVLKAQETLRQVLREKEKVLDELRIVKMQTENAQNENKNLKKEEKKFEDKINSLLEEEKELQKVDETREEYEASIQRAQKQIKRLEKTATQSKSESTLIADMKREVADWEDKTTTVKDEIDKLKAKLKEIGRDQVDAQDEDDQGSSSVGGSSKDDLDEASDRRASDRELEDLEKQLKKLEKDHEEAKAAIINTIDEKKMEEQKFESKCKRSDETVKELRNELKRARDTAKLDEKERSDKFNASQNQFKSNLRDIEKLKKELEKQTKTLSDLNGGLQATKANLAQTLQALQRANYLNERSIQEEERITREKKMAEKAIDEVKEKLAETHARLTEQREILSKVQLAFKEYNQTNEGVIAKLEEELYAETNKTEQFSKDRDEYLKEITRFRWYFRPDSEKKPESEVDPVAQEKFFERLREERLKELYSTRDKLKAIRPKDRTLKELQEAFQAGLAAMDELSREDMGYELEDLNAFMTKLNMGAKQRFNMFVEFVENKVDPGIVREIGALLELQASPAGLHPLRTAEHLIQLSRKDCKLNTDLKFRDCLLERLALDRHMRTHKDTDYCKIVILEGGEEWSDEAYEKAYGKNAQAQKEKAAQTKAGPAPAKASGPPPPSAPSKGKK